MMPYVNVSNIIGSALSTGMCTLNELQTIYGLQDVYDILEVFVVNNHNNRPAD